MSGEYISREAALKAIYTSTAPALEVKAIPAADVVERPRWIPVTERLPEDRHDVLVWAGVLFPYTTVGYYDGLWKFSFNDEEIAGSADYWMPLPEPPREGGPDA